MEPFQDRSIWRHSYLMAPHNRINGTSNTAKISRVANISDAAKIGGILKSAIIVDIQWKKDVIAHDVTSAGDGTFAI